MAGLQTDFNIAPFYDDYSANSQYYRILFRPSVAVQARELTQIQSILQNQISIFGSSIYKDGSIVKGSSFTQYPGIDQVRFKDSNTSTLDFNLLVSNYTGVSNSYLLVSNTTGLRAVVFRAYDGAESVVDSGSLLTNRAYVLYTNSGNSSGTPVKTFNSSGNEQIDVYSSTQSVMGPLSSSNRVGVLYTVGANSTINATGFGFGLRVGPGVIYQKGFFVYTEGANYVLIENGNNPAGIQVGYETREFIVKPTEDSSLYDNSIGSTNYSAPGAYRLKLTPYITFYDTANTSVTIPESFFPVLTFDANDGRIVTAQQDLALSQMGDLLAKRTFEQSGNFYISPFTVDVKPYAANNEQYIYAMSPGVAYVDGYRTEFIGTTTIRAARGITVNSLNAERLTANFGSYIVINEVAGTFDVENDQEISFYDSAQQALSLNQGTSSPTGTLVGKANIRAIKYYQGTKGRPTAQYLLYIFNVRMSSGYSFATDAKSVYATSALGTCFADLVQDDVTGKFTIYEPTNSLLSDTGLTGLRSLVSNTGVNGTQLVYRTTDSATVSRSGGKAVATFTLPGPDQFNYGAGVLSSTQELDINITFKNSMTSNAINSSGSITTSNSTTTTLTSSSSFTGGLIVGDGIKISGTGGSTYHSITAINSANSVTLTPNTTVTGTITTYRYFKAGTHVNLGGSGNTITINSGTSATVSLAIDPDTATTYTLCAQIPKYRSSAQPIQKVIKKDVFVSINCASHNATTTGPWCLGLPDVLKIKNVYVGSNFSTTNPDRTEWFTLDNGQTDSMYGLSFLKLNPKYYGGLTSASRLLVKLDHFTSNVTSTKAGFYSIDSYPINDSNTASSNSIATAQIPIYTSPSAIQHDLRNYIDFRPIMSNTAVSTNVASSATINPANNSNVFVTAAGATLAIEPDSVFQYNVTHYLPRIDALVINKNNTVSVKYGVPSLNPTPPTLDASGLRVAEIYVPPYPSLTPDEAS
jgi:hypothetical protein